MPRLRISLTVDTTSVRKINRVTANWLPAIKTRMNENPHNKGNSHGIFKSNQAILSKSILSVSLEALRQVGQVL